MVPAASWMATKATSIQLAVSKGSKKAVGDMMPVRLATLGQVKYNAAGLVPVKMIRKNTDWKREGFLSQSQVKKSNH
jgi:hypothetical protein